MIQSTSVARGSKLFNVGMHINKEEKEYTKNVVSKLKGR